MSTGTVMFYNKVKGFGFILDSSTKEEIYVEASGLIDQVRDGDPVTFRTDSGKRGIVAVDVRLA